MNRIEVNHLFFPKVNGNYASRQYDREIYRVDLVSKKLVLFLFVAVQFQT